MEEQEEIKPVVMMFGVPTFHEGMNVTVRKGDKYLNCFEFLQEIERRSVDQPNEKIADNLSAYFQFAVSFPSLDAIPVMFMALNHDSSARSYVGLRNAMATAYRLRDEELEEGFEVTVVGFAIVDHYFNAENSRGLVL